MVKSNNKSVQEKDIVLIGAGIMSATLGMMLRQLMPNASIELFERLDEVAAESSDAWNNAGTGHSALCELNYTPQLPDGSVSIKKAINIAEQFEFSKAYWAHLVEQKVLGDPSSFITSVPHMSFVWGNANVDYLKTRYETMRSHHFFKEMQYSEDFKVLREWMPLVMEGRTADSKVAATKMDIGTDVNFGALTRKLLSSLIDQKNFKLRLAHEVRNLERLADGRWKVEVRNSTTKKKRFILTKFIFIGAGGGALHLLEKSGIPEAKGFGGFPVSGQWLRCTNPEIVAKHEAKVYGKASVGSPPMSVPHLDTRVIDGRKALLFGPYAGFSTKFLKNGSWLDLPSSIKVSNIRPMLAAGMDNLKLTKYLIDQVRQSPEDRINALRDYVPSAKQEDWDLEVAGQRVQIIKKDPKHGGILEFGTEVVSSSDGSLSALLGASPGASTSVSIMLKLIQQCFPDQVNTKEWTDRLKAMLPGYGSSLADDPVLAMQTRRYSSELLKLDEEVEEVINS